MTIEPDLSPEVAAANGLRTGWTTGTCASAAAKAAALQLVIGPRPNEIEVGLPDGRRVRFPVEEPDPPVDAGLDTGETTASSSSSGPVGSAAVIKDAGDDPDCTDGAWITAVVTARSEAADPTGLDTGDGDPASEPVWLAGGDGVGTVTRPGLGLTVGGPAINPVPARMIRAAIAEVTDDPVVCTISVPGGRTMAEKTSNARLGIEGGISILGTTGVVKPFSTASYRASVVQQIDVAAAQEVDAVVLATGSRSDRWAQAHWPERLPVQFVEVGDFTGIALRRAAGAGITGVDFVGMAGKITKLAAGVMMTHFHRSKVDVDLLEEVATGAGAPDAVVAAATETNTARHFFEACMANDSIAPLEELCRRAASRCAEHAGDGLDVRVIMVDFEGEREVCRG
ncbi:MAG: cobalt-precorrin-5B (C(1))-methyltransferase [Actinomycetota bacterium]